MKKILLFLLVLNLPNLVIAAEFQDSVSISKLYGADSIKFGIDNAPIDTTCYYYGRHLVFDATTEKGKNMLSILLAAHLAGKKIDVWYTASTAEGSDETSGCTSSTMAALTQVGFAE